MKNFLKTRKSAGFTLIEILIALVIFSTVFVAALSIFVNSQSVQQRTLAIQKGQSDARYSLELLSRYIRLGDIDYEYYEQNDISLDNPNNPPTILALRDSNGLPARFQLDSQAHAIKMCTSFNQSGLLPNQSESCDVTSWVNITPSNIRIDNLDFYISPSQSPFLLNLNSPYNYLGGNYQEIVTIVLETTVDPTGNNYPIHFQTTISPRIYKR